MFYLWVGELLLVVMLDLVYVFVRKINLEEIFVMYCSVFEYICICIKCMIFFKILFQFGYFFFLKKYDMCLGDIYYFNWEIFKYLFVKVFYINIYSYYIFIYKIFVSGFYNIL